MSVDASRLEVVLVEHTLCDKTTSIDLSCCLRLIRGKDAVSVGTEIWQLWLSTTLTLARGRASRGWANMQVMNVLEDTNLTYVELSPRCISSFEPVETAHYMLSTALVRSVCHAVYPSI